MPPMFFRLFGLLFAAIALLHLLRPREMAAWNYRRGDRPEGRIEPTETRVLAQRIIGAAFVAVGVGMFLGVFP